MNTNEADLPERSSRIIQPLEQLQRDLAIEKFVSGARNSMRKFQRGEENKIILCAFDFAEDIMPLHAIVPGLTGKNYAVFYEELVNSLWEKAFGNAQSIDQEYNFTSHYVPAVTPRLKAVNPKGRNFNVNRVLWQLSGNTEGSLSRLRFSYSLREDSLYKNPPVLAEQWVVEGMAYTISALIPGQTTTRTRNWK